MKAFRDRYVRNTIVLTFVIQLLLPTFLPTVSYALMSGASQPEFQSFKSIGMPEVVNTSTGDFQYSIPLMDVGGYPINLIYDAGIGMDQESSWTGLGWNVNVGAINRQMRGIPDDFKGDIIENEMSMKPSWSFSLSSGVSTELLGSSLLSASAGGRIVYSNDLGFYLVQNLGISSGLELGPGIGLNLSSGPEGLNLSPKVSYSSMKGDNSDYIGTYSFSANINSSKGLSSVGSNFSTKKLVKGQWVSHSSAELANFSFANPSYTPTIEMPQTGLSFTGNFGPGVTFFASDLQFPLGITASGQWLVSNSQSRQSFGLLYLENSNSSSVVDVNRENDKAISKSIPHLPIPILTYDIFNIQGQGTGGVFWARRSEIGHLFDCQVASDNQGVNVGAEAQVGNLVSGGTDIRVNTSNSQAGDWNANRVNMHEAIKYKANASANNHTKYFKMSGEMAAEFDQNYFRNNGGFEAVKAEISSTGWNLNVNSNYKSVTNTYPVEGAENQRNTFERRTKSIAYLTASEVQEFGIERRACNSNAQPHHIAEIRLQEQDGSRYIYGEPVYNVKEETYTFSVDGQSIDKSQSTTIYSDSDISINNNKGSDHYFTKRTMPAYAYAWLITDVLSPDFQDISQDGPTDDDYGNYVRFRYHKITNNYKWRNPTSNDPKVAGYNQMNKASQSDDKANVIYGEREQKYVRSIESKTHVAVFFTSDRLDSKGVANVDGDIDVNASLQKLDKIALYSKTDWKNHNLDIENFELEDLDVLTPIQEVHFVYDYSLCAGVPNSQEHALLNPYKGKLTLKKMYFTYQGASHKGEYNTYEFGYNEDNLIYNPGYNSKASDIWGTYQPQPNQTEIAANPEILLTDEYPYTTKIKEDADVYASAWNLHEIRLPSAGVLRIQYESDDYYDVQNRHSMDMFQIIDIDDVNNPIGIGNISNELYNANKEPHCRIYFKRHQNDGVSNLTDFYNRYLKDICENYNSEIFFNIEIQLNQEQNTHNPIQAYATLPYIAIDQFGSVVDSEDQKFGYFEDPIFGKVGYIELSPIQLQLYSNIDVNPIVLTAMNYMRIHLPRMASDSPDYLQNPDPGSSAFVDDLLATLGDASILNQAVEYIKGPLKVMFDKNYCRYFKPQKSWLRLSNPVNARLGGGYRVKKVTISDDWANLKASSNAWETQEQGVRYTYTHLSNEEIVSSGNASFEPMNSKTNPFVQPIHVIEDLKFAPDLRYFQDDPVCYSYYPNAQIIYASVKVEQIQDGFIKNGVSESLGENGTGAKIFEYYTHKDYPTIVRSTDLNGPNKNRSGALSVSGFFSKNILGLSEGFCVVLNDMCGKPKKTTQLATNSQIPYSIESYHYAYEGEEPLNDDSNDPFFMADLSSLHLLDNRCVVVDDAGNVECTTLGTEWSMFTDLRESSSKSASLGANAELSTFLASIIPMPVPTVWPYGSYDISKMNSACTVKIIRQYGILKEVRKEVEGTKSVVRNLAWDKNTGAVILTSTTNEFNDTYYSINYPAYWIFKGMGMCSENMSAELFLMRSAGEDYFHGTGSVDLTTIFRRGDEVKLKGQYRCWVLSVSASEVLLIDSNGLNIADLYNSETAGSCNAEVLYSGNRNQLSLSAGSLLMKNNPIQYDQNTTSYKNLFTTIEQQAQTNAQDMAVINATATLYKEHWQGYGVTASGIGEGSLCETELKERVIVNPFLENILSAWRPWKSYSFRGESLEIANRSNIDLSSPNGLQLPPDVRTDGVFNEFIPFWRLQPLSNAWMIPSNDEENSTWQRADELTMVLPFGIEAETKDALGHFKTVSTGFNHSLVTAQAVNTRNSQIFFESFEELNYQNSSFPEINDCVGIPKLNLGSGASINQNQSHTGNSSVQLIGGSISLISRIKYSDDYEQYSSINIDEEGYHLHEDELPQHFGPFFDIQDSESNKYLVSFWIKQDLSTQNSNGFAFTYAAPGLQIFTQDDPAFSISNLILLEKSDIIDGWQKFVYTFEIVQSTPTIPLSSHPLCTMNLTMSSNPGESIWIDDIRVQPIISSMQCFVYDAKNLRLMAILDDNNYATFYDYDEEGKLQRMRQETERGIYTIKESRKSIIKR